MTKQWFEFELYRINIYQTGPTLFEEINKPIETDSDIVAILRHAVQPKFKTVFSSRKNTFEWAVRDFVQYHHQDAKRGDVYGLTLAKSAVETTGEIVTDTGIEEGISEFEPPLADTCRLFFYMERHLMVIERRSAIVYSRWRQALEQILKAAAQDLEYLDWLEFEPVPRHEEIVEVFRSFERLTRLRVTLRLPNPELSRYAAQLYKEMEEGAIREYLQDMKNPRGLNKADGKLPHATLEIATAGYKRGEVTLEGIRNNKQDKVKTGKAAARGRINVPRDFVRGMKDIAETKKAQRVTIAILVEIDRIAPPSQEDSST